MFTSELNFAKMTCCRLLFEANHYFVSSATPSADCLSFHESYIQYLIYCRISIINFPSCIIGDHQELTAENLVSISTETISLAAMECHCFIAAKHLFALYSFYLSSWQYNRCYYSDALAITRIKRPMSSQHMHLEQLTGLWWVSERNLKERIVSMVGCQ